MLTLKELLSGADEKSVPKEYLNNLNTVLERINKVRTAWGRAMNVTSGYRSLAHHLEIYKARGITDHSKIPMTSKHLFGQAVDIDDDTAGTLWFWLMQPAQMQLLKDVGLWLEHGCYTHNKKYGTWVHFQILPPSSNHRIFVPSAEANPNPTFWDGKYDSKYDAA